MAEQLNIILVPHTHWDREWYQTFQQFRVRLVKAVDRLLDILDHDEHFSYFMLDGQTIVLDDYLEVQPQQEEHLKRYTRAGRVLVGPWYVQPDEFLVSGESLIRNLQIGLQRASEFGSPMRVGYVPDCFGHIAQLPQILQGCDIDNAVFWRGVGAEVRQSEFFWTAPDGSRVLVIYLADPMGYSNARQMPLNPEEFVRRTKLLVADLLPKATTDTLLFMNGSDHLEPQAGLPEAIAAANKLLALVEWDEKTLAHVQQQRPAGPITHYHSTHVQIGTLPLYIERVRQQHANHEAPPLETLSGEMRSGQFAPLLPSVLSTRIWIKQQNAASEHLLERWVEPLTAWAANLGASYPQGLINIAWRYLLQNHPHDSICGCSIDQVHRENSVRFAQSQQIGESVLSQAMQYLVSQVDTRSPFPVSHSSQEPVPVVVFNPAPGPRTAPIETVVQLPGSLHHAVIVDESGEHMPYRVVNRWRQEIGTAPLAREMLSAAVSMAGVQEPAQLLQMAQSTIMTMLERDPEAYVISRVYIEEFTESPIHHAHHTPQPGVVFVEIMLAPKGRVSVNEQEIITAGQHILGLLEREDVHTLEVTLVDQARENIEFLAANLPAYGLKTFWLYPRGLEPRSDPARGHGKPLRSTASESFGASHYELVAQSDHIENEFYRVEVNAKDGTLTVTDKRNGAVFSGLNRFVDGGDVGDLYNYCPPEHDTLISEPVEPPKIELLNSGPVCATLRVSGRWALPNSCTASRQERSSRITVCPIVSDITLIPGVPHVNIHTSIENRAKDHRLRVVFPVSYIVEHSVAEGTFEVRTRPVVQPRPADVSEWVEEPVNVYPQKRFVDLSNGEIGLSVLNRGLPEYEVVQGEAAGAGETRYALALTLLRCVEWLSRGDLATRHGHAGPMEHTPEAQCQGHYEFDYALVPHSGTWEADEALLQREALAFNTPITTRAIVTEQHEGSLPAQATFVKVAPRELVVSAVKRSNTGRGLIVRIYNPLDRVVEVNICPGVAFERAYVANLLEEYQESLAITSSDGTSDRSVQIRVRGGGIITLGFE